ncbi:hypothetical protein Tco_0428861 [Tanacetum coccineum]
MVVLFVNTLMQNTMAEQNVPAQAPTRTDEQIFPRSAWLQIKKSNMLFNAQKIHKKPIFQISVDILRNTNFFRAFSTSASVPAIYIQQFWNTMKNHTPLRKVRKGKPSLVDEEDEARQEPKPQGEGDDPALELAKKLSLDAHQEKGEASVGGVAIRECVAEEIQRLLDVEGKGKAIVTEEQAARSLIDLSKKKSTMDQFILQRRDQAPHDSTTGPSSQPQDDISEKVVHESSSTIDSERIESGIEATAPKVDKEQGEVASTTVTSGVGISVRKKTQALEKEHLALAGPNPEHMDEDFYATAYPKVHENLKLRTDEHVILENLESSSATLSSMKNLDETDNFGDQFLNDKPTEDDQEKTNVVDETDSIIPDPSYQTNTSAPLVTTLVINISYHKPSSQVNAPPINTEATSIITTIQKITPFIALQLRVTKLEQDMSEVKKTDHSTAVLDFIQSQVPTVVDKYLGTKVDDTLLKALEKHTPDLIQKYSGLPASESSKKQESEKSTKEIIRIKREQEEQKHVPTYTIKSNDTTTLKEFDLKAALFKTIHENKSANRNPANNRLYHALMEALIEDENAMEKEVADKVKDHKRKHDSDDDKDDDDEGPPAGSNQGKSTKRRRYDSGASGSAQPPSKDSKQSTKNKLDSDASVAQQPPAHTLSAWKITNTRDAPSGPLMPRSEPQSGQYSNDIQIQNEEQDSDSDDNDNAHVPKVQSTTSWFSPQHHENNWENVYATTYQDPEENKLQRKTGDIGSFIKWFCKRTGKKKLCKANLEGDKERKTALSISKLKAARYLDFGLEELVPSLWVESERDYDISAAYGITHWWVRRKEFYINKHREPSDRDAVRSHMRILSVICIKTYERYGYNYLREIVLRRADYKEYKISEKDFKNLHPNDFEDLFLLHLQDKLNYLPKSEKKDYTIVNKPRAVIYRDRDDNKKMMRINEVHKFSDGTLMRIRDKLDFMVKDFRLFKFNKGMETRKWTEDDKRRSEDFIKVGKVRRKSENKGIVPTEMELVLEYTQQGSSHEVSVGVEELKRIIRIKGVKKEALRTLRQKPENPSETKVFHNEDGNPARANIKQAFGSFKDGDGDGDTQSHKGVKASANSNFMYFFTSAPDGNTLQDDERLGLADDLMKAQVHNQIHVNDESKDY